MFVNIVFLIFFIWLVILTAVVFKAKRHYHSLVSRTKKERIDDILDALLEHDKAHESHIKEIKKELDTILQQSQFHFQKIGLVRFNPFGRSGGEQSFVLSLLDRKNNGFIINFMYTHEGMRAYAKKIHEGKGKEYELSGEEKEAIEKAH